MAYYNNSYQRPQQGRFNPPPQLPAEIKAEPLPTDYVDAAETVMRRLAENNKKITTSKIRNIFSLITDIYNVENLRDEPELAPESVTALTMMRIRMVYEAGREQTVKTWQNRSKRFPKVPKIPSPFWPMRVR